MKGKGGKTEGAGVKTKVENQGKIESTLLHLLIKHLVISILLSHRKKRCKKK